MSELRGDGRVLYWLQSEPGSGCARLWHLSLGGPVPVAGVDGAVRSRVNGYGGGAYAVLDGQIAWVDEDQSLWWRSPQSWARRLHFSDGGAWGGLVADHRRQRVLAVREQAHGQSLVAMTRDGDLQVLHSGQDFYSAPTISGDGRLLAWVSWSLPDMPWHRSQLWLALLDKDGRVDHARCLPTPAQGSVQQPRFEGRGLTVLSDHDGWWQPYQVFADNRWQRLNNTRSDHANAPWQLAECHACSLAGGQKAWVRFSAGYGQLWLSGPDEPFQVAGDFAEVRALVRHGRRLACLARFPDRQDAVIEVCPETGQWATLAGGARVPDAVVPESLQVPAPDGGHPLQVFYYPPVSGQPMPPPAVFLVHGGPTSATYAAYNPQVQFWCQRGFAVVDVNYRGSSGFGRVFRESLREQWGRADVEDLMAVARVLAAQGRIDARRRFILGRSAGGYTALMAAMSGGEFSAVGSQFGVSDPMSLRAATHRFESGYLDWLLGCPDTHPDSWHERTPARNPERLRCPAIFFQGRQDTVVVPEQTRAMVSALKADGAKVECHWFDDEGHGFRRAENQAFMLDATHRFFSRAGQ
jgi:dipeptidyl aminopeptidase/acylaminoacyl peptidase